MRLFNECLGLPCGLLGASSHSSSSASSPAPRALVFSSLGFDDDAPDAEELANLLRAELALRLLAMLSPFNPLLLLLLPLLWPEPVAFLLPLVDGNRWLVASPSGPRLLLGYLGLACVSMVAVM